MPTTLKRANVKVKVNGQFQDLGLLQSDVATQLADEIAERKSNDNSLEANKIPYPLNPHSKYGNPGNILTTDGEGGTRWTSIGQPTDEQVQDAIDNWLYSHPEATTTVQNHSLTYEKLVNGTLGFVTPEMFGAIGDGVTDDTNAIQAALNVGGKILFSNKTYLISMPQDKYALKIKSNTEVDFAGATIKLAPYEGDSGKVFRIANCENVKMNGPGAIIGDRLNHTVISGEQGGALLSIRDNAKNVFIDGLYLAQCYGDGIYIGEYSNAGQCPNTIYITNCIIDSNRRNGISVISGVNIFIDKVISMNHTDQSPKSGIDIEPNHTYNKIDIKIGSYYTKNNSGPGLSISNNDHDNELATTNFKVYAEKIVSQNDNSNIINTDSTDHTIIIDSFIIENAENRPLSLNNISKSIIINNLTIKVATSFPQQSVLIYATKTHTKINNFIIECEDTDSRYLLSNSENAKYDIGTFNIKDIALSGAINYAKIKIGNIINNKIIIDSAIISDNDSQYDTKTGDILIEFDANLSITGKLALRRNYAFDGSIVTIINKSSVSQTIKATSSQLITKDGGQPSNYSLASNHTARFMYSQDNASWYEI